jgi:hypothetical protein
MITMQGSVNYPKDPRPPQVHCAFCDMYVFETCVSTCTPAALESISFVHIHWQPPVQFRSGILCLRPHFCGNKQLEKINGMRGGYVQQLGDVFTPKTSKSMLSAVRLCEGMNDLGKMRTQQHREKV